MAKVFARLNLTTQAAVKDIPADCRAVIEQYFPQGMKTFTKFLYHHTGMDLNKLTPEVKTFKRLSQAEIDKCTENNGVLLIQFNYNGQQGIFILTSAITSFYSENKREEEFISVKGRDYRMLGRPKNVVFVINQPETWYKAWAFTFPEGSSTMDLRNQRSENKKGAIFRTPKELQYWMSDYDKNGYKIEKNKYKKMLEQIRQEDGRWAKKTESLMLEFLDIQKKAIAAKKLDNIKYELQWAMEAISNACLKSLPTSYYDDKERAKAFNKSEEQMEKLKKVAKDNNIL